MSLRYCNVALPVPLRRLFTYSVPSAFAETVQAGSRVLVPFRNRSMVGVVVAMLAEPPAGLSGNAKIREVSKVLDLVPALTPKLIELAQWIAGYYLAPIGEVFRGMLPPVTEVKLLRDVALTRAGREAIAAWKLDENAPQSVSGCSEGETKFLELLSQQQDPQPFPQAVKWLPPSTLQKLQRRGLLEIRERVSGRARRMQRVIAWKGSAEPPVAAENDASRDGSRPSPAAPDGHAKAKKNAIGGERLLRIRRLLQTERGPLPLSQLLKLAEVSRGVIDGLLRDEVLESWEEPLDPAEDPFDAGYTLPAHELNAHQENALKAIRARFALGEFGVQLLFGVTGSGKCICGRCRIRSRAEKPRSFWFRKSR
jgi:primosomal protein N' (replication factor Y)